MCGITGVFSFNSEGTKYFNNIDKAISSLKLRGPDSNGKYIDNKVALGHSRLSIIDTSDAASQPFTDITNRYVIVFNGEIYNFQEHRKNLINKGISLKSNSDTEVLLYLYIEHKEKCLEMLNGFFAFAIYDKQEKSLFLARDRMGIKPVLFYRDENSFVFGSELKALIAFGIPKEIDNTSLHTYFQFNYIPGPQSIFKNVTKLNPGNYIKIIGNKIIEETYYKIPYHSENISGLSYKNAKNKLYNLLEESVHKRMIADVPLGAFLSGGIDSSVIVSIASKFTSNLNTFSVGYADEPFFDETNYAQLVAKKFKTNHTVFKLTNNDLYDNLFDAVSYLDEPFADSSALPVYILSKKTRQKATVALSGDGADELFSGYNKHAAHYKALNPGILDKGLAFLHPIVKNLPQSRNNSVTNLFRQIAKYSEGMSLNHLERYWRWCAISSENFSHNLLLNNCNAGLFQNRKEKILNLLRKGTSITDVLHADMHLVLQNDMLPKVDFMSMANSLEVRTPFLDHDLVNFVFSLPDHFKITKSARKRILQDTFYEILPKELYHRHKHGFEVPLLKWFRNELRSELDNLIFNQELIKAQGIFNWQQINLLNKKLNTKNPGEIVAQLWAIFVFQHWWTKYYN